MNKRNMKNISIEYSMKICYNKIPFENGFYTNKTLTFTIPIQEIRTRSCKITRKI